MFSHMRASDSLESKLDEVLREMELLRLELVAVREEYAKLRTKVEKSIEDKIKEPKL